MEKVRLNYFIDVLLAISFLIVAVTGIMKWPGISVIVGFNPKLLLPNTTMLHDMSGVAMTILVLIHLLQHKDWIICMTKEIFFKKKKECDNCTKCD